MLSRRCFTASCAAIGVALPALALGAETYPARAVKIIVPFPPGTASEFFVRLIADRLASRFGEAFVVENRPGGAGGTLGASVVAGAAPDGYMLLASPPGPLVTAAALYKNLNYDPAHAFEPIALLFSSPQLLIVNSAVPANTVEELVAYARQRPGELNIASPGFGTQPHLLAELLKKTAQIDVVHVPYKGPGAAMTALLAGQVQVYFETAPVVLPHVHSGKIKLIAVAGNTRFPQLPDVPTTVEAGFAELTGGFWAGILAPARTPPSIVRKLNNAINEVMRSPQAQANLANLGGVARLGSPEEFSSFITSESEKWAAIIKAAGIQLN
jgi:tripartite-type tricarboxylate transporter receptor subunit TctC